MTDAGVLWATGAMSIGAVIASPLIALWVQRRIEAGNSLRERREAIFRALWVNRRRPFYVARVDALNMIDVEFAGLRMVEDAWEDLRAHYFRREHPGLNEAQIVTEREEKYAKLLFEISQVLGYRFGPTHIRDNIYRPELHGQFDEMELETRTRIRDLLRQDALPVRFVGEPNVPAEEE